MSLLPSQDWSVAEAIAEIGYTNPFLPARISLEKQALGTAFVESRPFLQYRANCSVNDMFPNATALRERSDQLLALMRGKLIAQEPATERELAVYEDLVLYQLYARHMSTVLDLPAGRFRHRTDDDILSCYDAFAEDHAWFLKLAELQFPSNLDRDVIFAGLFQVERAFFHIFRHIVGASPSSAALRASIWQSVFTHDVRRYLRTLHNQLTDIPTLITGPSGTGKELVAQAITYSSFIPFDPRKRRFVTDYESCFVGLNLSAIAPTLIESELFGHAKGAFTDARTERQGYLDESMCPRWGSVFLDEIGELDARIQVKLLRVIQNREFQRVGDSKSRRFVGKIVAATNRDLSAEVREGRFREDFYYRLCADRIETPSLRTQLTESPDDLNNLVRFIATRLLPELPEEAVRLADEAISWISDNLGSDYPWPGNIRELEQCVRSILIRGSYMHIQGRTPARPTRISQFVTSIEEGDLSREELLTGYFSLLYSKSRSYRATGRRLGVDWRTVKATVDDALAREFASIAQQ